MSASEISVLEGLLMILRKYVMISLRKFVKHLTLVKRLYIQNPLAPINTDFLLLTGSAVNLLTFLLMTILPKNSVLLSWLVRCDSSIVKIEYWQPLNLSAKYLGPQIGLFAGTTHSSAGHPGNGFVHNVIESPINSLFSAINCTYSFAKLYSSLNFSLNFSLLGNVVFGFR